MLDWLLAIATSIYYPIFGNRVSIMIAKTRTYQISHWKCEILNKTFIFFLKGQGIFEISLFTSNKSKKHQSQPKLPLIPLFGFFHFFCLVKKLCSIIPCQNMLKIILGILRKKSSHTKSKVSQKNEMKWKKNSTCKISFKLLVLEFSIFILLAFL